MPDPLRPHCTYQEQRSFYPVKGLFSIMCLRSSSNLEILTRSGFLWLQLQIILEPFLWKKSDSAVVSDANANER